MTKKLYYVQVDERELQNIEAAVYKRIVEMMTKEISDHSRQLAVQILQGKPIKKKKWYQSDNDLGKK